MNTPVSAQSIPNHLAWAIISTVLATCLCCPLGLIGIVAIVYSTQVNSKLGQGDIEGARNASANAKTWCWVATALAIIGLLINIWAWQTGQLEQYMEMMRAMENAQQ